MEQSRVRRTLGVLYKWLMPVALVAAIGVAAVTLIEAADRHEGDRGVQQEAQVTLHDESSEEQDSRFDRRGRSDRRDGHFGAFDRDVRDREHTGKKLHRLSRLNKLSNLAELVGTDVSGLREGHTAGMTLAAIAESNGVDPQTVVDALVEQAEERLDAAVESGKLSAEEAEAKLAEWQERIAQAVNEGGRLHR